MSTNPQIVELINGIIAHGNHLYTKYSVEQFDNMRTVVPFLEELPTDGIVYIKHVDGVPIELSLDNTGIDKADDVNYQVLFSFDADFDCEALDLIELYDNIEEALDEGDFNIDFDGNEYRIISDGLIWDIYVEATKDIVEDCYDLKLNDVPSWIALEIDWEQTAKNAYADGYGPTFSSYDGSESQAGDYWIFQTN